MNLEGSGQAPWTLLMSPPCACTHSRLISDCVSEEEHKASKVRCVECGGVVPDPHLQLEVKGTQPASFTKASTATADTPLRQA
jgi:hypothetical protein